jgi:hypothetical protein
MFPQNWPWLLKKRLARAKGLAILGHHQIVAEDWKPRSLGKKHGKRWKNAEVS